MYERAFTMEFLRHAKTTSGWPAEASVAAWCGEQGFEFMQNGVYARIAAGDFVDDRQVRIVVYYLLEPKYKDYPERRSLNLFLLDRGVENPARVSAEQVVKIVSMEVPDEGFGLGVKFIHTVFNTVTRPSAHVREIKNRKQLREAVGWLIVDAGRQLHSVNLPMFDALAQAEQRMAVPMRDYEARAAEWWDTNLWSVVRTVSNKRTTGVALCLPVTETFYNRCCRGECRTMDCQKADIEAASRFLIVEGVAPSLELREHKESPGASLLMAMVYQQARLSDVKKLFTRHPLRMLSFTGTPVGARRLKKFGFKPLGTFFPGTNIEYFERELTLSAWHPTDAMLVGLWRCLQMQLRRAYRPRPRPPEEPGDDPVPEAR